MVSVLVELAWAMRRAGVPLAPSQTIDLVRATILVGFDDPSVFREAVRAVVVTRVEFNAGFERAFGRVFGGDATHAAMTLEERLAARSLNAGEIEQTRAWLGSAENADGELLAAWLARGASLDRLVAEAPAWAALGAASPDSLGFLVHKLASDGGFPRALATLTPLELYLRESFGEQRARTIHEALQQELEAARRELGHAARERGSLNAADPSHDPSRRLAALTPEERRDVERALIRLVERIQGSRRVHRRHALRGRVNVGQTIRAAQRTFGVPMRLYRRAARPSRQKLVLLCDLSDSVRDAARFFLLFAYLARELFETCRVFVFVSDLREATEVFAAESFERAAAMAWSGGIISIVGNSNYGKALGRFVEAHPDAIDAKTTVVILGDGRTNFASDGRLSLEAIRDRARAVLWLCPEPEGAWGSRDSAMPVYAARVTRTLTVSTPEELLRAVETLRAFG